MLPNFCKFKICNLRKYSEDFHIRITIRHYSELLNKVVVEPDSNKGVMPVTSGDFRKNMATFHAKLLATLTLLIALFYFSIDYELKTFLNICAISSDLLVKNVFSMQLNYIQIITKNISSSSH